MRKGNEVQTSSHRCKTLKNFTELLISNGLVLVIETLGYKKFIVGDNGDNNGGGRYGPL